MDEFDVILKEITKKLEEKGDNPSAAVIKVLVGGESQYRISLDK